MSNIIEKLVLGTVQFGLPGYGINFSGDHLSDEAVFVLLEKAWEAGIRKLDTAPSYGRAHELIGAFHKQHQNIRFQVNTKISHSLNAGSVANAIDEMCSELHVEQLDCCLFHSSKLYNDHKELEAEMTEVLSSGNLRFWGVSIYDNLELKLAIDEPLMRVVQSPFNLLDNNSLRADLFKEASTAATRIQVRSVFLQGLLFKESTDLPAQLSPLRPALQAVHKYVQEFDIRMEILALAYALRQSHIQEVLIGTDSIAQLQANVNACKQSLDVPEKLLTKIDSIRVDQPELLLPHNWN